MNPIFLFHQALSRVARLRDLVPVVAICFGAAVDQAHAQDNANQQPKRPAVKVSAEILSTLESHMSLEYAKYGERSMELDLFRPKVRGEALPAIVCIHGGGWYKGERASMTNLAQGLAARGYVTVTISYRLSGEAKFPAAIQDCKAAVRWLRAHAKEYGVQADRIGVTGLSAGGHLAALLATSSRVLDLEGQGGNAEFSSAVQAAVAMGAQSDLESARIGELSSKVDDPFYRTFLGGPQSEVGSVYALASPRHHLDATDPPLAFMTGELDDPSTHAEDIRADMKKLNIATGLTVVPNAPHAFLGQQINFDFGLNACDRFFQEHLKGRREVNSSNP